MARFGDEVSKHVYNFIAINEGDDIGVPIGSRPIRASPPAADGSRRFAFAFFVELSCRTNGLRSPFGLTGLTRLGFFPRHQEPSNRNKPIPYKLAVCGELAALSLKLSVPVVTNA